MAHVRGFPHRILASGFKNIDADASAHIPLWLRVSVSESVSVPLLGRPHQFLPDTTLPLERSVVGNSLLTSLRTGMDLDGSNASARDARSVWCARWKPGFESPRRPNLSSVRGAVGRRAA